MRSFSNLWFWIALAVMWSTTSHWVLGVPFDLVQRARRQGAQAAQDLEDLARIHTQRLLYIAQTAGLWLLGIGCFLLTALCLLGFVYGVEIAQALFLLGFPLSVVSLLSLSTARQIAAEGASGEALQRRLTSLRRSIQGVGVVSIFVTSLWGTYQNLTIGVLGG